MATPYIQLRLPSASSTQDVAREEFDSLPVLVITAEQTQGRGRSGAGWETAPRALATSLAVAVDHDDLRPFSLMAGVAATKAIKEVVGVGLKLKWPNDLMVGSLKVGGILVERSADVVVVGMGVNLWWPEPMVGAGALYQEDPGGDRHVEVGALWGAEMMRLVEAEGWPYQKYRSLCATVGKDITWEPDGRGRAIDVSDDGGLVVEVADGVEVLHSGAVRHIR